MLEVELGSLAGLRTVLVEGPGPLTGGLCFRGGQADERLSLRGITHLVEHLALMPVGQTTFPYNGGVDLTTTIFWAQGTADEVRTFLAAVAGNLQRLPLERLEAEQRVLSTEAAQRKNDPRSFLLTERYGAEGPGLVTHEEYAFRGVKPEQVQEWADLVFVQERACLLVAGEAKDLDALGDIELQLASGDPAPPLAPVDLATTPGWLRSTSSFTAVSWCAELTEATFLAERALERRLHQRLRIDQGIVYGVQSASDSLGSTLLHTTVWSEALPDHRAEVANTMRATVRGLADHGSSHEECDEIVTIVERMWSQPAAAPALAFSTAQNVLMGRPYRPRSDVLDALSAVEPDEVGVAADTMWATSLWLLPDDSDKQGLHAQTLWDEPRWEGGLQRAEVVEVNDSSNRLVVNEHGVAFVLDPTHAVSTAWDDVAAVLRYEDSRVIVGRDGRRVFVHPAEWTNSSDLLDVIDGHTDPSTEVVIGSASGSGYLNRLKEKRSSAPPTRAQSAMARALSVGPLAWKPGGLDRIAMPLLLLFVSLLTAIGSFVVAFNPGPNDSSAWLFAVGLTSSILGLASAAWLVRRHRETQRV